MTKATACPECGARLGPYDQTCQKCGRALSYAPDEPGVGCAVCGAEITAYTVTCPACGETGYPALRPRKGRGFKGSPELEAGEADGDPPGGDQQEGSQQDGDLPDGGQPGGEQDSDATG